MILRLTCLALAIAGCSKETELYELPIVGEPACVANRHAGGPLLARDLVVVTRHGKDFVKRVYIGVPSQPSGIALAGKTTVKITFQQCGAREPGLTCDVANAVTYAEREVELDPARLHKLSGRRAENPQVIDFVWPNEPITCGDGSTPHKAK